MLTILRNNSYKIALLLFGFAFWYFLNTGSPGINLVIIEMILLAGLLYKFRPFTISGFQIVLLSAWIISCFSLLFVHSVFAFLVHYLVFIPLCMIHMPGERSYLAYTGTALLKFIHWDPERTVHAFEKNHSGRNNKRTPELKYVIFPVVIILGFFLLYANSVPFFLSFFTDILADIRYLFRNFNWISFWWMVAGIIVAALFWKKGPREWVFPSGSDNLLRIRKIRWGLLPTALLYEHRMFVWLLVSLNLLLLFANSLDIRFIWLADTLQTYDQAQWAVRYGTFGLILALAMSIVIAVHVFRANQNFYRNNRVLKWLTYFWLLQNLVQVASLCIRNMEYISEFNLAYKRMGIFIFCIAVIFGITSTMWKIARVKSVSWLIRINSHFIMGLFLLASFFSWDEFIVRYNLNHPEAYQDMDFMCTRNNRALLIILENNKDLDQQVKGGKNFEYLVKRYYGFTYRYMIYDKLDAGFNRYQVSDWKNWNYRDADTYSRYKEIKESLSDLKNE